MKLLKHLPKTKITTKVYLTLPENPGIYIYYKKDVPIYVGKAINLKSRIASYFRLNLETKTKRMLEEANYLSYINVEDELDALLLEARLIKDFQPKYNIIAKDDKEPLYIQITKEEYPRIIVVRKADLNKFKDSNNYGPFPSSKIVKSVLRMLRRIFPYSEHKLGNKPCLYSQIGLCNPCPNEIAKSIEHKTLEKMYLNNIRHIKSILNGNINNVKKTLEKQMKVLSETEKYEQATEFRNKIQKLEYITNFKNSTDLYLENPNLIEEIRDKELRELSDILGFNNLSRIECYDVAHLQGKFTTASMVTFINGVPEKRLYRHFRIRQIKGNDDYASMRELAKRRINNLASWGIPDLVIVDGGKGQLSVFQKELENLNIPVIGLAKRQETLIIPAMKSKINKVHEYKLPKGPALNLVQRMRNEAHRFAQAYHHKLFKSSLFESTS